MKLRALIVDDSKVMRAMVMDSLRKSGLATFEFIEAADGVEALSKFNPKRIDIAFVDWNMPNMSGIDFVREVRDMGKAGHIPIVMVTSEKTIGKLEEALDKAGADAFISKPFTVDYLIQKLDPVISFLERRGTEGGFLDKLVGGGS